MNQHKQYPITPDECTPGNTLTVKHIWKFPLKFPIGFDRIAVEMPDGAEILTVQIQDEIPCIWALVNPRNENKTRHFEMFGTGHKINCYSNTERKYINTFQFNNGLLFHLFERIS